MGWGVTSAADGLTVIDLMLMRSALLSLGVAFCLLTSDVVLLREISVSQAKLLPILIHLRKDLMVSTYLFSNWWRNFIQ